MDIIQDFIEFLKEYGIIALALAVVVGMAVKDLVNAVVQDLLMPFVGLLLPGEGWREAVFHISSAEIQIGHLIGAILDFLIILLVVYLFLKYALKEKEIKKI